MCCFCPLLCPISISCYLLRLLITINAHFPFHLSPSLSIYLYFFLFVYLCGSQGNISFKVSLIELNVCRISKINGPRILKEWNFYISKSFSSSRYKYYTSYKWTCETINQPMKLITSGFYQNLLSFKANPGQLCNWTFLDTSEPCPRLAALTRPFT